MVANVWIDPTQYSANDGVLAILFFAAHFLSLKQKSRSFCRTWWHRRCRSVRPRYSVRERSVVYAQRQGVEQAASLNGPGESTLATTFYGQMYLMLRSLNIIPVMTV